MNQPVSPATATNLRPTLPWPAELRTAGKWFAIVTGAFVVAFAARLLQLAEFAWGSDLYSYALLMPLIAAGIIWIERDTLATVRVTRGPIGAAIIAGAAMLLLGALQLGWFGAHQWSAVDRLVAGTYAFVLLVVATAHFFLGAALLRHVAFATLMFTLTVPFPSPMERAIETFLQQGSAPVAEMFFRAWGTPVFRVGVDFQLPRASFRVAEACSGINSTVVLAITSLVAGRLLLRPGWQRWLLVASTLPIALLRNGLRVFVLGQLADDFGRHWFDSALHHRGGPIYFALSMIPLFGLIVLMRWMDLRARQRRTSRPA